MMKKIHTHLLDAQKNHPPSIVEPMLEKYKKYWLKMKLFAAVSQVFDP